MTRYEQATNGQHKSSAEIEREIDRTRDRIESRARQLEDRLSPGQLLDQAMSRLKDSGPRDFVSNLGRDLRDNPLPVLLTGAGLAWLMSQDVRRRREEEELFHDDLEPTGEGGGSPGARARLREGAGKAREGAHRARERVGRAGERLGDAARAGRERARGVRRSASHGVREGADRVRSGWDRMLDEQPLLLGLFGLAAGAAIASALPPSETEDEWMGDASDSVKRRAARGAREATERARDAAERAGSGDEDGERERSTTSSSSPAGASAGSSGSSGATARSRTSGAFGTEIGDDRPGSSGT